MRERSHDRRDNRCYGTGTARSEYTHLVCAVYSRGVLGESGSRGLEGAQRRLDRGSRVPAPLGVFERFTYSRFADFRSSNFVSETEIEGSRVRGVRRCVASRESLLLWLHIRLALSTSSRSRRELAAQRYVAHVAY